jgi:hypothetical protein
MQYTTYQYKHIQNDTQTIYYLNTAQENPGLSSTWQAKNNYSDSMDVLYAAVFQQTTQYQPYGSDPWGNPLIPVVEYLLEDPPSDPTTWLNVDLLTATYVSYYGIPLADISEYDAAYSGTWNFTMQSSYLYLDCPSLRFETIDQITEELAELNIDIDELPSTLGDSLTMSMTAPTPSAPTGNLTFISSCSAQKAPDGNATFAYTVCALSQTFVLSNVSCANTNCSVISVQKQPKRLPTEMASFMPEFLKASDTGLAAYPLIGDTPYSITELYIRDPGNATEPGTGQTCDLGYLANDTESFTQSLSYLINTFYSTGFTHDFQVGSVLPPPWGNITLWNSTSNQEYHVPITDSALGVHKYQSDVSPFLFGINWAFIAIFEFCALALLLIGIAGVLLESRAIAPDVLGWVNGLTRHSKYVKLPKVDGEVDGVMSSAERAKRLGETRVMMQDISRPGSEVGRIVLGSVSEGAERLKRGRVYR